MALLYMDGFDVADAAMRWGVNGTTPAYDYAQSTRFGIGKSVQISCSLTNSYAAIAHSFTPSATIYIGAAVKITLEDNGSCPMSCIFNLATDSGASSQIYLRRTVSNAIAVYRGDGLSGSSSSPSGTLIAQSPANAIDDNWRYVQVSATIHATTGRVIVYVDGALVIDFTGNTKNTGTSTNIDLVRFKSSKYIGVSTIVALDDVYICNNTGTANNTFMGDVRVQTMLPTGAGSSTQLAPTGSANNWQNVSEVPYNNATYNASSTVGQSDLYTLGDLTAGTTGVFATQSVAHMQKSDAGTGNAKVAIKSGASTYYDATQSLGSTVTAYTAVRETDPATSAAWTVSAANALEAGVEVA
jgi:hypothetical protein